MSGQKPWNWNAPWVITPEFSAQMIMVEIRLYNSVKNTTTSHLWSYRYFISVSLCISSYPYYCENLISISSDKKYLENTDVETDLSSDIQLEP